MINAKIDQKSVIRTMKTLSKISKTAPGKVARFTVNDLAFKGREGMQNQIDKQFIQRNKFTRNRVFVNKARGNNPQTIIAEVGHTEQYMKDQNDGAVIPANRKTHAIPTKVARISSSEKRLVRRAFNLRSIGSISGNEKFFIGKTKKGVVAIFQRLKTKVKMLYNISKTSITIKRTGWMGKGVKVARAPNLANMLYMKNAKKYMSFIKG